MAKKFLTGLKLVNLSSDPASGEEGELYFNTTASVAKIYKQGAWSELGSGAGGGSTITVSTTAPVSPSEGDEWYKNDTGELYIWDGTYWVEVNGTISASGVLTNIDSIAYPDYITFDTTPEIVPTEQGSIYWDSGDQGLRVINNSTTTLVGQQLYSLVKNATGSSIAKGKVVYINGAQGQRPTIALADADGEPTSSKTFGIVAETIADGAEGLVANQGILRGVNTDGLTEGGSIWLSSTAGGFTQTMPTQPAHSVFLGYVVKAHATAGEIYVIVQNGYELNELHDVLIDGTPADNEVLAYNSASSLWTNQTAEEANLATRDGWTYNSVINIRSYDGITDGAINLEGYQNKIHLSDDNGVIIGVNGYTSLFSFNNSGALVFPDASSQTTAFLGMSSYSTTNLSEGSNLYFTDERSQDAAATMITNGVHTGMSVQYVDSSNIFNFTNTGVTAIYGTSNEIEVSSNTGNITIGIPDSPTLTGDLTVTSASPKIYLHNGTNSLKIRAAGSLTGNISFDIPVSGGTAVITSDIGSTVQGYDADLAAIAALTTTGIAKRTGDGTWSIITDNSSNWDTAYGWGNHAVAGYLTSETDPVFLASEAYGITSASTSAWNTAYGWGNHATAGYLTSYTETDTLENVTDRGATSSNAIEITNSTAASSPTTGALIVTGGVGIGEDLYVNNDVHIGGDIHITGSISGSLTYVNVSDLVVTDPLIYLAESNPNDSVDIGIFAALNHGGPSYEHTGLIRDASDSGKWKLVSGLGDPTSNVIDFTSATYDTLKIGSLEVTDSSTTRTNLGLAIGTDVQAYNATLAAVAGGTYSGDDSITTVGTISSGTWEGTKIDATHGGTNQSSWTTGDILYASATNTLSKLTATTDGYVLTLASGVPTWAAASGGGGGLSTTTTSITTNSATVIESFGTSTSRTAEAIIQITQGTDYYSSKALFIHDGTNVKITEYAILESTVGAIPVTISAAINGSNVELSATITDAATTNATAKVILIEVAV